MQTGSPPLFSLLSSRMSWLSARQGVLAENVANADTPSYIARDVKPVDFESLLPAAHAPKIAVTNARHLGLSPRGTGAFETFELTGQGGSPSGSSVSLEKEMIKLSDTQIQYQTATSLYQKAVSMFRTALGGRG